MKEKQKVLSGLLPNRVSLLPLASFIVLAGNKTTIDVGINVPVDGKLGPSRNASNTDNFRLSYKL